MNTEINKAFEVLKKGGIILYPTDTVWGIGCDATNYEAIEKIYLLKQRTDNKSMICLVSDFKMLNQYLKKIPEVAYDIIRYATKPTSVIYDNPVHVAENIIAKDNSLAIRVVREGFANKLIKKHRRPIVSTSANISGQPTPKNYQEISSEILKGVDYIVNLQPQKKVGKPSAIIKLSNDGQIKIIR